MAHERMLDVPGTFTMAGCNVQGPVRVTFMGRAIPRGWRERLALAFDLMFRPGRVERLYLADTRIVSCVITSAPGEVGVEVSEAA